VKGPQIWVPATAAEEMIELSTAVVLQKDEYAPVINKLTGEKWIQRGEAILFVEPHWFLPEGTKKAFALKKFEYIRLLDKTTGIIKVHRGEQTVFPGPQEVLVDNDKLPAVELKVNEYIKMVNQVTGEISVERGPKLVFLGAQDRFLGAGKQVAVEILVERFDRRGTEPFELFRSEFGQNSFRIKEILLEFIQSSEKSSKFR